MRKPIVMATLLAILVLAAAARAHFVFVVPNEGGESATVVFSDSLEVDENVKLGPIARLKLTVRGADGKDLPAEGKAGEHAIRATLPGTGPRVVSGSAPYGVMRAKDAGAFLLVYHPGAVLGGVPDRLVSSKAAAELVPVASRDGIRLRMLAKGKPVADAEVNLIKADGTKAKLKTDKDGWTGPIAGSGRLAAWARYTEASAGEHEGKKYAETRHYATLVFEARAR